ncbi:putative siderophore-binding lipoprotein YfiY precursor [Corynebacterium occultum]|uniref:Putative siderophore-binding lipoprotein YfiY n=1 Tax=Corynebacterium occultum TaxID=2675219 RepID=A0A6B8W232_9CORY|nr:iron-siderophore ABC transporter substrate-binding protein [Corynebacterium occultum]QGU06531.1 putative siderophore-binding lipoprotein YfiY precursor [Corynebacterium occultum]
MTLRTTSLAALGISAALLLSGCSGSQSTDAVNPGDDWEPVSIDSALGTATIEQEPERIITLGQGSTETAIALGTVPVGMEEYPWGSDETGYMPWIHEAVTEEGAELPTQFSGATELDIEAIIELDPDLILAPWSGVTQEQYDLLSEIAPTVAYPEQPWTIEWEQQIELIAEAMGRQSEGRDLITRINTQLDEATVPEYEGLTFSYIYNSGPGTLGVFYPEEQRAAMVAAMGLTPDPVIGELRSQFDAPGTQSALIGLENADRLKDSDLIFTFYSDDANRAEIEAQPLYASIPAVARGSVIAAEDQPFVTASSMINPLTVPWVIERYQPMIDAAVAKLGEN